MAQWKRCLTTNQEIERPSRSADTKIHIEKGRKCQLIFGCRPGGNKFDSCIQPVTQIELAQLVEHRNSQQWALPEHSRLRQLGRVVKAMVLKTISIYCVGSNPTAVVFLNLVLDSKKMEKKASDRGMSRKPRK